MVTNGPVTSEAVAKKLIDAGIISGPAEQIESIAVRLTGMRPALIEVRYLVQSKSVDGLIEALQGAKVDIRSATRDRIGEIG